MAFRASAYALSALGLLSGCGSAALDGDYVCSNKWRYRFSEGNEVTIYPQLGGPTETSYVVEDGKLKILRDKDEPATGRNVRNEYDVSGDSFGHENFQCTKGS